MSKETRDMECVQTLGLLVTVTKKRPSLPCPEELWIL